jgi:hypothetical protein
MKPINLENDQKINSGFKVPDNYFENFSENILNEITENKIKVIAINNDRRKWFYAAAAILIIGITLFGLNKFNSNNNQIDNLVLENYLTNHSAINDNDIANLLTNKDFQKLNKEFKLEDKILETEITQNENLEEYLLD